MLLLRSYSRSDVICESSSLQSNILAGNEIFLKNGIWLITLTSCFNCDLIVGLMMFVSLFLHIPTYSQGKRFSEKEYCISHNLSAFIAIL